MRRALILILPLTLLGQANWPQFGGPNRDFASPAKGLLEKWPANGPKQLWRQPLGEGYSGIACDGDRLFTMTRKSPSQETVVALDAATGKQLWEYSYAAPQVGRYALENGPGPHTTPAVASGRVFSAGITQIVNALDAKSGKVLWTHDLMAEYGSTTFDRGYASSPLLYRDLVIFPLSGPAKAFVAFRQNDGSVAWNGGAGETSGSSPILIEVGGMEQLVMFLGNAIGGFNPLNGDTQWREPHKTTYDLNVAMPVYGADGILVMSSAYSGGAQGVQLTRQGDRVISKSLWEMKKLRVHHGNLVRIGDTVYGSSGDFGPAPITAVDVKTGKVLWQNREFAKASIVLADGKGIVVDEDGMLGLVRLSSKGMEVLSKFQALSGRCWTAPTIVGSKLYVRSRDKIVAYELK